MHRTFALFGSFGMLLGVALGAFAAHGLKDQLSPYAVDVFETGVKYQIYHALGLLALALVPRPGRALRAAGTLMAVGIVIFSGTLYALAITGVRWLGAITPIGGLCFIVAWGLVFVAVLRLPRVPEA